MSTTDSADRAILDLPLIRDEIVQKWLLAEARSPNSDNAAQYCCFTHQDGVKAYQAKGAKWHWLDQELSSNLAGETGAVHIYKGALSAMRIMSKHPTLALSKEAYKFCREHRSNEESHLRFFEAIVPDTKRTRLLSIWRLAGWTLGFLPTMIGGSRGLYVTVEAVETFVEEHFQQQIVPLKEQGGTPELVRLLEHCCEDEVHHKKDAARKLLGPNEKEFNAWWVQPWSSVVRTGSSIAAEIARRV